MTGMYECNDCPAGYSCDPVSQGVYGIIEPSLCNPGHYCPAKTQYITQYPCPPGTYSNAEGLTSATSCSPCSPGFYCDGYGNRNVTGECNAGY